MPKEIEIGGRKVGRAYPAYVVAEIGINHNGDLSIAKKLIDVAMLAGCDAVKFQKRTPDKCVPEEQKNLMRETPWGIMTYLEYRYRVEFGQKEYAEIDRYCKEKQITWFASCWDEESVDFIEQFKPACYKLASASLTDDKLIAKIRSTGRPLIISTGMSTLDEIKHAVEQCDPQKTMMCHATSTYPCKTEQLNLKMIHTLDKMYDMPIGYSGHEVGLQISLAAVVMGACYLERHITLDRAMWGSDHAASLEPQGIMRLVRDIRAIETGMGDGVKQVYPEEIAMRKKMRRA